MIVEAPWTGLPPACRSFKPARDDAGVVERAVVVEVLVLDRDRRVLEVAAAALFEETGWRMLLDLMKPIRVPSAA